MPPAHLDPTGIDCPIRLKRKTPEFPATKSFFSQAAGPQWTTSPPVFPLCQTDLHEMSQQPAENSPMCTTARMRPRAALALTTLRQVVLMTARRTEKEKVMGVLQTPSAQRMSEQNQFFPEGFRSWASPDDEVVDGREKDG